LRKINPELWLVLFLVLIAAALNFLVASQRMALVFYFLPILYSACHFGRRHATLTALASIVLVVLLVFANPATFNRRVELPFDARWFDLALWGGVLMVAGYVTGTLYERNQKTLREMEGGYDGMLSILQNFLANQKYSDAHAYLPERGPFREYWPLSRRCEPSVNQKRRESRSGKYLGPLTGQS